MQPLRVLWLIDHVCYDGDLHGGGRLFMSLPPRFDRDRIQIFPYFLRSAPEIKRVFEEARRPVVDLARGKYDPTTLLTVDRLCREHGIDVMHLFCYAASTFGRLVGRLRGVPTVIQDFDTQVYFPYPPYLKAMDRLLAAGTGRALASSSFCRDYMRDVRKVPGDRIDIMYHALSDSLLEPAGHADRAAARARLRWPQDAFVFAAITKLGPDRGNETLLRAFKTAVEQAPQLRLALVYKPTLYHRLPAEYASIDWARDVNRMRAMINDQVRGLDLERSVDLIEMSGSLEPYYAASDMLVAPFENVRFSSVNLVEGLAYGRPFIATDLGEPKEIAKQFEVGVLVPPKDPAQLANVMLELAGAPERVRELGRRASDAARQFTVKAAAERLSTLYETLAAARRHAAATA
jgi:glycosyltransferase involved in cell wall biosynthesis